MSRTREHDRFFDCTLYTDQKPTNADRIRSMSDEGKREALIDYFSQWAGVEDSYIFDLGRVKSAFGCGTMTFEDFTEWDESRIAELVDEFLDYLRQPVGGGTIRCLTLTSSAKLGTVRELRRGHGITLAVGWYIPSLMLIIAAFCLSRRSAP